MCTLSRSALSVLCTGEHGSGERFANTRQPKLAFCSPAQRAVHLRHERAHHLRAQLAVVPEQRAQTPGQGADPMTDGHARQHRLLQVHGRVGHASAQTGWTEPALLAAERHELRPPRRDLGGVLGSTRSVSSGRDALLNPHRRHRSATPRPTRPRSSAPLRTRRAAAPPAKSPGEVAGRLSAPRTPSPIVQAHRWGPSVRAVPSSRGRPRGPQSAG